MKVIAIYIYALSLFPLDRNDNLSGLLESKENTHTKAQNLLLLHIYSDSLFPLERNDNLCSLLESKENTYIRMPERSYHGYGRVPIRRHARADEGHLKTWIDKSAAGESFFVYH